MIHLIVLPFPDIDSSFRDHSLAWLRAEAMLDGSISVASERSHDGFSPDVPSGLMVSWMIRMHELVFWKVSINSLGMFATNLSRFIIGDRSPTILPLLLGFTYYWMTMLLFRDSFSGCSDVASVISSFCLVQAGVDDQRHGIHSPVRLPWASSGGLKFLSAMV